MAKRRRARALAGRSPCENVPSSHARVAMKILPSAAALLVFAANALAVDAVAPATAPSATPAASVLPPRIVADTDKAQFRRFTLPNGMKVLLATDPNFNKSAASL